MKERDISIDILKFFAALLITNSHMDLLYGKYSMLATGGAIGDVLFFFASGFTLFMGQMGRFDNWYKRRINRIYPTVFAWAIVSSFVLGYQNDIKYTILHGGGWFVSCIMLYYIVLWFIRKFTEKHLWIMFAIAAIIVSLSYFCFNFPEGQSIYGNTHYKWIHYFLFMLLGAIIGSMPKQNLKFHFGYDITKLIFCLIGFYTVVSASLGIPNLSKWQIVSLLPLLGIAYYSYKVCNSRQLKYCYNNRHIGGGIRFISGLCLEIYIVQYSLFTDSMNGIFPFNIPIMFIIILIAAYLLRCVSRIFSQTFKDGEYNWKKVFKLT